MLYMRRELKRGHSGCEPFVVREKKCKSVKKGQGCKYKQEDWSDCDPVSNVKVMVKTLKRGDPGSCPPTETVEKLCKRKKKLKPMRSHGCKYRRADWSTCDKITNIKTMRKTLKRGDPSACPATQVIEKICKRRHEGLKDGCKYRKSSRWSECDPVTWIKTREVALVKGDDKTCLPKKTVSKVCKSRRKQNNKMGCKYSKKPWGPCDAATNTVTRTLTLKSGDPNICNNTKLETGKCRSKHLRPHVCKYKRTTWEECHPTTNMKKMVKTLKRGDTAHCQPTETIERKCKGKNKAKECQYTSEAWTACDPITNTITRRQKLKSGPSNCQSVKEYSRKCKKPCKFDSGKWSECQTDTNQMTRIDTLKVGSAQTCPKTRLLTKKCGKGKKCVYDAGTWSECDTLDTPSRTRTQNLVSGDPGCKPVKTSTKSCNKKNGTERCFYGPWQEYDACQNGVQKKRRLVVQGDIECERKSVKMKPC